MSSIDKQDFTDLDLHQIRRRLATRRGRAFWSALETAARAPAFQEYLEREFPAQRERFADAVSRRDFLRCMGASLALAGATACTRQPDEKIVPFARSPEATIPGKPLYFATSLPRPGGALGVLVESHSGRPTKIEGNQSHPSSLGATDSWAQAEILGLYDPDRSSVVLQAGQIRTWDQFVTTWESEGQRFARTEGEGLFILSEEILSPTLAMQRQSLLQKLPGVQWHQWQPIHRDQERDASIAAFGRDVAVQYRFDQAQVVVSLDSDFIVHGVNGVRHARDFAGQRRGRQETDAINRLYAAECSPTLTGAMADHRLAVTPDRIDALVTWIAGELGVSISAAPALEPAERQFGQPLVDDLKAAGGRSILVAGLWQSTRVQHLIHLIHERLGCVGETIHYTEPAAYASVGLQESLTALLEKIKAGEVKTLVILGGNPVYSAPPELQFSEHLQRVPLRIHLSAYEDETSRLCHWHLPQRHPLEAWSDLRAADGTTSLVQPLIAPLYDGHSAHELVAVLAGDPHRSDHDRLREHWRSRWQDLDDREFDRRWQTSLHDGLIADSAFVPLSLAPAAPSGLLPATASRAEPKSSPWIAFRPDANVWDGRFSNNGWLQETPRPLTRTTWGNLAWMSTEQAEALGVRSGQVIKLSTPQGEVEAPVWVSPDHPDGVITLHLGYGRQHAGRIGDGVGFDAGRLRPLSSPWFTPADAIVPTNRHEITACVQDHQRMEGRDLVRTQTWDSFQKPPANETGSQHGAHGDVSMYPEHPYENNAWAMVIDLNACVGCNACMVACQAENNIPIVGKEEVEKGRELHWIRIDRYYETDERGTRVLHQPVPCMHCENAPCEVVCPVGATVHSSEGLNEMVYNRCVGTRYCSNNCPYKVRRFNFFPYSDYETEVRKLGRNPDVTVRTRGVMEKCTYCVQRINQARITAKKEGRAIRDGEVVTACEGVCPTQAITFGNQNDETSRVAKIQKQPHRYELLGELGAKPRTTYLTKLTNPHSDGKAS